MPLNHPLLNAREIATIFWLAVFSIWAIRQPAIRASLRELIRAFFVHQILVATALMVAYIATITFLLHQYGFWKVDDLAVTLIWTIGTGLGLMLETKKVQLDEGFLGRVLLANLKFGAILEFVVNLHPFPLWIEMVTMPLVTIAALMKAVSERDSKNRSVTRILTFLLVCFGLAVLVHSGRQLYFHQAEILEPKFLVSFLLPLVLTVLYLPFIYSVALVAQYEVVFAKLRVFNPESPLLRQARLRILFHFHFRLWKMSRWHAKIGPIRLETPDSISRSFNQRPSNPLD